MKNVDLLLFKKGNFSQIDVDFILEGSSVLQTLSAVQDKYKKHDTDVFLNELRDSIAGRYLGFDYVNSSKHGIDCKKADKEVYLEVKSASFVADAWQATFNDTTLEKAEAFKDEKLFLVLAVWNNAADLYFLVYGQNEKLGEYLEEKVRHFKTGATVRSTQSLSISTLVLKFGFKVLCINKNKQEVLELLKLKNRAFYKIDESQVIELKDFQGIES